MHPDLIAAQKLAGIVFMGQPNIDFLSKSGDNVLAMDAQPQAVTQSNSGIPAFLSTFIDPKIIDILVAPMKATEIVGAETKKGDWVMETALFPVSEATGETSAYGDYSENGQAGSNTNYVNRQSFHYQVFTQWGERELEKAGLGKIDWASRLNLASVQVLNKFQNKSYFFGVAGLENYGLLNDPSLPASITPTIKAAGGTAWLNSNLQPNAQALEVVADVQTLFAQLQNQTFGLVELDSDMTLAMSPVSEVAMTFTNQFNNPVADLLKKIFPNLKIKNAPEYATASGNLVQLIVDTVEGQRTAETAFTEKLRAHPIVIGSSNFKQKKSQGTWGTIIYRPIFIASMIGV
jgi:hypothetical protein